MDYLSFYMERAGTPTGSNLNLNRFFREYSEIHYRDKESGRGGQGVRKFYGWIQKDQRATLKDKFELTMFRKMS